MKNNLKSKKLKRNDNKINKDLIKLKKNRKIKVIESLHRI